MVYKLMNHDYPTADIEINDTLRTEYVTARILDITDLKRLPMSIRYAKDRDKALNEFLYRRCIPENRYAYGRLMALFGTIDPVKISLYSHGMSLADGYWLKKEKERISWEKLNYYDNKFSYDMGNFIFHKNMDKEKLSYNSPDLTIHGKQRKIWRRKNGKLFLLKIADPGFPESIYNEIIGSEILNKISRYPYVHYYKDFVEGCHVCFCENFLGKNMEFISALELFMTKERPEDVTPEEHILERMAYFEVPDYLEAFRNMRLFDYITSNTDRHLQNFGVIRDVVSLKYICFAPLFDYGGSLWSDEKGFENETPASVKSSIDSIISLGVDIEKHKLSKLKHIDEVIEENYSLAGINEERTEKVIASLKGRIESLEKEYYRMQLEKEDFDYDFH